MKKIWELFANFFKIGLFTFGGGYAMLPLIEDLCVEKKGWITHEEMMTVTVIAESTPGPVAINCSTYVGKKQGGLAGALAATFGVVLPSFLIIFLISLFLENFLEITLVANAFRGIRIAVGLLILQAGLRMIRQLEKDVLAWTLLIGAGLALLAADVFGLPISTIVILLAAALISLAVFFAARKKGGAR